MILVRLRRLECCDLTDSDSMFAVTSAVTLKTFSKDKVKAQRRMLAKVHEKYAYTRDENGVKECQYLNGNLLTRA